MSLNDEYGERFFTTSAKTGEGMAEMNIRFIKLLFALLCLLSCSSSNAQILVINIKNPVLLAAAKALPNSGTVKQSKDGFVYLKVSEDFITKLNPLLKAALTKKQKRCLIPDRNILGAHASILYSSDIRNPEHLKAILGKTFHFTIQKLQRIVIEYDWDPKRYEPLRVTWYVLAIHAPKLLQTALTILPSDKEELNELHISIAVANQHNNQCVYPYSLEYMLP